MLAISFYDKRKIYYGVLRHFLSSTYFQYLLGLIFASNKVGKNQSFPVLVRYCLSIQHFTQPYSQWSKTFRDFDLVHTEFKYYQSEGLQTCIAERSKVPNDSTTN